MVNRLNFGDTVHLVQVLGDLAVDQGTDPVDLTKRSVFRVGVPGLESHILKKLIRFVEVKSDCFCISRFPRVFHNLLGRILIQLKVKRKASLLEISVYPYLWRR